MICVVRQHHDGRDLLCPIVECDICGKQITDGELGMYKYAIGPNGQILDHGRLIFAHKGGCDDLHEQQYGDNWYWGELTTLLIQLGANMGIDWNDPQQVATIISRANF
jgi:hypothetical protein